MGGGTSSSSSSEGEHMLLHMLPRAVEIMRQDQRRGHRGTMDSAWEALCRGQGPVWEGWIQKLVGVDIKCKNTRAGAWCSTLSAWCDDHHANHGADALWVQVPGCLSLCERRDQQLAWYCPQGVWVRDPNEAYLNVVLYLCSGRAGGTPHHPGVPR